MVQKKSKIKMIFSKLPKPIKELVYRFVYPNKHFTKSHSQCGEDIIISNLVAAILPKKDWTWIDIGAHHPTFLNNTALFYKQGKHGINIEANPVLITTFYGKRKRDLNLNIAIADKTGTMNFYVMNVPLFSTLSEKEAREYEKLGYKIEKIISIQTMTLKDVVDKYCEGKFPEVLLLDAEGYDFEIIKTIDMNQDFPKIICVENIPYRKKLINYFDSMQKNKLSTYLINNNYSIIAFTLINTIFVHNDYMEKG